MAAICKIKTVCSAFYPEITPARNNDKEGDCEIIKSDEGKDFLIKSRLRSDLGVISVENC